MAYNYEADMLDSALKLKAHCKIQFKHRHGCQDCCFMCFMDRKRIDECPLSAMRPEQWDISDELTKLFSEQATDTHAYLNKVAGDTKEQKVTPAPKTRYRWLQWGRDSAYNRYYRCSNCQHEIMLDDMCDPKLPSSCEYCGATMKERE